MSRRRLNDLIGLRFGRLLVIEKTTEKDNSGHYKYLCKCSCGNEVVVSSSSLRMNRTKSCGCWKYEASLSRENKRNKQERLNDFGMICDKIASVHKDWGIKEVAEAARMRTAPSLYIRRSYIRAIVAGTKKAGENRSQKAMFAYVKKRYAELKEEYKGKYQRDLVDIIFKSRAPRFYFEKRTASNLYYEYLRNKRKKVRAEPLFWMKMQKLYKAKPMTAVEWRLKQVRENKVKDIH